MSNKKVNKPPRIPTSVPKKDHYQRIAYLYQLGGLTQFKVLSTPRNTHKILNTLSRQYINHMESVGKKAVLKLHPNIKRSICKNCSRLMIPGINMNIENMNSSKNESNPIANILQNQCQCGEIKRYPYGKNPQYELFVDKEGKSYDLNGNGNGT